MKYDQEEIGKIIKHERTKKKWSQDTLGKKLGVTGKQISNYEKAIQTPPVDILFRMCELFDCELGYLLGEESYQSGTKLDTAIENKLKLSPESISSICHITGTDRSCLTWGYEAENYQRILNSFISDKLFIELIESIHSLDHVIQQNEKIWTDLEKKYGKEALDTAFEYYNSTTDYLHDDTAEKIPDINYDIITEIENSIDKEHGNSFPIKVLRYEVRESFERLLDNIYPQ